MAKSDEAGKALTVLGPVDLSDLGVVIIHEQLFRYGCIIPFFEFISADKQNFGMLLMKYC